MEPKLWYQSKTMWIGLLEVVIGVLGLVAPFLGGKVYTPEAFVLLGIGVLTVILRKFTDQPIA